MNFFLDLFFNNFVFKTDSYKLTHWKQLRIGTTKIVSYLEARTGALHPSTIFFGLQPIIKKLEGKVLTEEGILAGEWFAAIHLGNSELFNLKGWLRLLEKHKGMLPITIKAVAEGTNVSISNVLVLIENNDDEFPWLTNYIEGFLQKVWYPTTIATNSFYCKKVIVEGLKETSGNLDHAKFALHDFGYRGVTSEEQAGIGGAAHLTSFYGTDNIQGIIFANQHYTIDIEKMTIENYKEIFKMYGFSIAASEHSTATPFGPEEGELAYIEHMLKIYPENPFSIVIDSFNAKSFPDKINKFKKEILARPEQAKIVLRPDSGNPVEINLFLLNSLWKHFSGTYKNDYRLLNSHIGIIQGDGIDYNMIVELTNALKNEGWATDNLVFGSGGGLLQKHNRDTERFAIKCCSSTYNGEIIDVRKNPSTDSSKTSKAGYLKLHKMASGIDKAPTYQTFSTADTGNIDAYVDSLIPVFKDGKVLVKYSFEDVRKQVEKELNYLT